MSISKITYVHHMHQEFFLRAAKFYNCHILVRETGLRSIQWIGKPGYTGKRADLKAKTADQNALKYTTVGLVCSPILLPEAFSGNRYFSAMKEWQNSEDLITDLNLEENKGLSVNDVKTPYFISNNKNQKHYLIRKILQLVEANKQGEARWWLQRSVDAAEASQDGSAG